MHVYAYVIEWYIVWILQYNPKHSPILLIPLKSVDLEGCFLLMIVLLIN